MHSSYMDLLQLCNPSKEGIETKSYLKECLKSIEEFRLTLKDGYLQQICDDIIELLSSTLYKLKFLK